MGPLPIANGRRFGCTRCGACCLRPGMVYFDYETLRNMAEHLKLSISEFKTQHDAQWDPNAEQWYLEATPEHGCKMLDENLHCRVDPVKPMQCKTFPFWPELLDDALTWEHEKQDCPGLDAPEGRLYTAQEIRDIARERATT